MTTEQLQDKSQLPEDVQYEIDAVKLQLGELLVTQEQAVKRIGNALQRVFAENPQKICAHIKYVLKEYIAQGAISEKRIEQICQPEWKNEQKAIAGRAGAEKSSAEKKKQIALATNGATLDEDDTNSTTLRKQVNEMQGRMNTMQLKLDTFLPAFQEVRDSAIVEDDYVKIPRENWDRLLSATSQ